MEPERRVKGEEAMIEYDEILLLGFAPRLLVVQPDRDEFAWLRSVLGRDRIELHHLQDPEALGKALEALDPDAILVEADLPAGRGVDLCRQVRRDPRGSVLPLLCLTRRAERDHMDSLFRAGADDCVLRQVAGTVLLPCLLEWLDPERLARRVRSA